jgi:hypothetical protein
MNSENSIDMSMSNDDMNSSYTRNSNDTYDTNNVYKEPSSEIESESKLEILNKKANIITPKPFYMMNILEIIIELKNTWFQIMDELMAGNYSMSILIKNNRMFYVGLTILIMAIIMYIYDYMIESNSNDPLKNIMAGGNVVEIRHIYEPK